MPRHSPIHPMCSRRNLTHLLVLAVLLCGLWPGAGAQATTPKAADVLVFTNGDQLTGTLVRAVDQTITFNSEMAGEISVPMAKIKELRAAGNFAVLPKGVGSRKKPAPIGQVEVTDGHLSLLQAAGTAQPIAPDQLGFIVDQPSYTRAVNNRGSFLSGWNGTVTGGITLVRATQNDTTLSTGAALVREVPGVTFLPPHNRTSFNLSQSFGKLTNPVIPQTVPPSPVSVAKTNIFHTDVEFDRYFSLRLYVLADTDFDHNYAEGLQLQQVYGGGFGYTAIKEPLQQLDLKGEAHYESQRFIGDVGNQQLVGGIFGETYRRNLPFRLVFSESGTVSPAFNNTDAYSAHVQAVLSVPAYKRLSFSITGSDDYINNPPPGYRNNSVQFVTGITYALR